MRPKQGSVFHGLYNGVGDPGGAHLWFQIVGRNLGRGHQQAIFPGKRLFHAAIEEVGDVSIFLGFGHPEIP
jgi:hypothetical protein